MLFDTGPVLADMPFEMFARAQDAAGEHGVPVSFGAITHSLTTEELVALENVMKTSMGRGQRTRVDALSHDVADLMGGVTAPTMVVRSRDSVLTDQEQTRRLVTGITGAQMRVVSGTAAPFIADLDAVAEAFVSFLTSDQYVSSAQLGNELRTVVFTDLVSSTEVLSRLGDDEGRAAFRDVEAIVSKLCSDHHGRLIKHLGDGSLISFKSTQRALAFGLELQQQMHSGPLGMRVGMAAGEPIQQDDDIHGAVVVQASRIADVGQSGEIVVADSVRQLAIGKGFSFEQVGEVILKGFDQPTSIWKVTGSHP
jgi:class 3 adenylate cyclase